MTRRKRKHIPREERLAAALVCLLPQAERDYLRRTDWPASRVIALFTFDHIHLHAWGGSDEWRNLDPKRRGAELKAKDASDTSRAAKARRLDEQWGDFMRRTASGRKPTRRQSRWPKRKLQGEKRWAGPKQK
jgi:hypothetical protein